MVLRNLRSSVLSRHWGWPKPFLSSDCVVTSCFSSCSSAGVDSQRQDDSRIQLIDKSSNEALWKNNWTASSLRREALSTKAGRGRFRTGTGLVGRLDRPVDLDSRRRKENSWTALISHQARSGQCRQALKTYEETEKAGVEPSRSTVVTLLKACSSLQDLATAKRVHTLVVSSGFESDLYIGTMLVDMYAKCRSLVDARLAFEKMPSRNVVSWSAMIWGYAQMKKGEVALQLYIRMQQEGVAPNDRTYVCALKACSSMVASGIRKDVCLEHVRSIHADIVKGKFESDLYVGNMLVDVYAKCGNLEDARTVFEKMPCRDMVSWNAMIMGYAQMGKDEVALQLYSRMKQEGVERNDRTHVSALKACSIMGERNAGKGISVNEGCLVTVRSIHADLVQGNCGLNLFVRNMLVDAYAKCGSLEHARLEFEQMVCRDVVSWNAMILGYAQMDEGEEALQMYSRMQKEGVERNDRTYVSALKACSTIAESAERSEGDSTVVHERCLEAVRAIHRDAVTGMFESDFFVGNMLVDAYAKCGGLEDARQVFENMPCRTVVSWNAMILGYAQVNKGEEALELYNQMQQAGVVPDGRTYVSALNACADLGELNKGKEIHAQILKAGLQTTDCFLTDSLISMYGKCGSMVDAQQLFEAMPLRGIVAWNALIAGYANQGESEVVFDLFQRMQQEGVQPDGITFLGVLTVCSHVGLVHRGQEYFRAMSSKFSITHTIKHFTCLVDLLGRSGQLDAAMEIVNTMPFIPNGAVWGCILNACCKWGDVELGRQAFACAVRLNKDDAAAYVSMANIFATAHMRQEAKEMQAMRVKLRAWKQPGWSRWTDTNGKAHVFVVGDPRHPESQDIHAKLQDLLLKTKNKDMLPMPSRRSNACKALLPSAS